jgi:hypothetical protein
MSSATADTTQRVAWLCVWGAGVASLAAAARPYLRACNKPKVCVCGMPLRHFVPGRLGRISGAAARLPGQPKLPRVWQECDKWPILAPFGPSFGPSWAMGHDGPRGGDATDLRAGKIHHRLDQYRDDAIMVEVAVPGERWEIEFLDDGTVEAEVFRSDGDDS